MGDYKPSILRAIKSSLADIYDRIGLVIFASLIWFVTLAPTVLIGLMTRRFGLAVIIGLLWHTLVAPITAGIFYLAGNIVKRESPGISDMVEGAKAFMVPAWKLAAVQIFITSVLIADVVFFYSLLSTTGNMLFIPLAAISFYAFIFWGIMVVIQWPLLIEQRPTTMKILTRSFLLAADNLSFTTGIYFAIIVLSILCLSPGMALLYMGAVAVICYSALRELFRKYGLAEIPQETADDSGWHIGDYK